jgi:polyisoprenoid-binding protein YceI
MLPTLPSLVMLQRYWYLNFNFMKRVLFCILVMSFCVSKAQEKWVLDSENSFITYEASHFLHDWSGTNQNIKGVLVANEDVFQKIAIAMYIRDFDSRNDSRDNNALEILEVLKFPKIEFFSDQIEKKDQQIKFYGSMSFHGIEVNKEIDAQSVIDSKKLSFKGVFDLSLSDFGVPLPSFMMRKMEDEVVIKYELNFQKLER